MYVIVDFATTNRKYRTGNSVRYLNSFTGIPRRSSLITLVKAEKSDTRAQLIACEYGFGSVS